MSRLYEALQQSLKATQRTEASALDVGALLPDNVAAMPELPAVGSPAQELEEVPKFELHPSEESRLVALTDESGMAAEKVRMLITRLRHLQRRRAFRRVLITSAVRGEGKSMTSANLAVSLARQNQRTLLIDGDLRRPSLSKLFGVPGEPGLSDWWQERGSIVPFLRRVDGFPLWFLSAGNVMDQPDELLQSLHMTQLLAQVGQLFDWVIVDSPPVGPIADAGNWVSLVDVILIVVRHSLTPKKLLLRCLDVLDRSKIIGLVLNDAECVDQKYYRGYYGSPRRSV